MGEGGFCVSFGLGLVCFGLDTLLLVWLKGGWGEGSGRGGGRIGVIGGMWEDGWTDLVTGAACYGGNALLDITCGRVDGGLEGGGWIFRRHD